MSEAGVGDAALSRERSSAKRRLGWWLIGLVAAGAATAALTPLLIGESRPEADAAAAFQAPTPADTQVRPSDVPDHRYSAQVPADNPAGMVTTKTYSVGKDDVVEFNVSSPRPGMVAVHGLLEPQAVQVGGTLSVKFRTVYSGRFPLHFHGADGSHFEIAAVEVLTAEPKPRP